MVINVRIIKNNMSVCRRCFFLDLNENPKNADQKQTTVAFYLG